MAKLTWDKLDDIAFALYETIGFTLFGILQDFPPGHNRHYFFKRIDAA